MLSGVITQREILKHPWTICRSFGLGVFIRCLWVVTFHRRSQTFLEILQLNRSLDRSIKR